MKLKHNKKRNTAFLYEVLVRHLTKSILDQDLGKKNTISNLIKVHFRKGTSMREELDIYKAITMDRRLSYHMAERLLFEAKRSYSKINQDELFQEQSQLIKKINQALSKEAYSVFIPNYKNIASIQQIFNDHVPIKTRMLLEEKAIRNLTLECSLSQSKLSTVDSIVYRTFVKKFNKRYGDSLLEEQKTLLGKYISSFTDNGLELKIFLNEEVGRLKTLVEDSLKKEEVVLQGQLANKIKEVLSIIENFKNQEIDQDMVERVLKIQSLVREI